MKILLTGYFGFGNAGDEMILHVMKKKFREMGYTTGTLAKDPEDANEFNRSNIVDILSAIKRSDVVVNGGGGILQDKTSIKSLYYYLFIMKMAKMMHKKVAVFAQGIGPINKKMDKVILKNILNSVDLITVRDTYSLNTLKNIGIKKPIYLTADLAFLYKEEKSISLPYEHFILYTVGRAKRMPPLIVLADVGNYVKKVTGLPIIIVPFYPKRDREVTKELSEILHSPLIIPKDIAQYVYIVEKSTFVIGMRYHSLLLSALKGKAFAGLSYDPKVTSIMQEFGVDGIKDYGNLSITDFRKVFEGNFKNRSIIQKELEGKVMFLKKEAEKNFELFKRKFEQ